MGTGNLAAIQARRLSQWTDRIARQASSGMTIGAFCRSESISIASFYSWRKRLDATAPAPRVSPDADHGSFIDLGPVRGPGSGSHSSVTDAVAKASVFEIRLELGGGIVLHLSRT